MAKAKQLSNLEMVQRDAQQALDRLNNANLSELPAHCALEQVRATLLVAVQLARISEALREE